MMHNSTHEKRQAQTWKRNVGQCWQFSEIRSSSMDFKFDDFNVQYLSLKAPRPIQFAQ